MFAEKVSSSRYYGSYFQRTKKWAPREAGLVLFSEYVLNRSAYWSIFGDTIGHDRDGIVQQLEGS